MGEYIESQTVVPRSAAQSNNDKLVQVDALATNYAQNREMQELVLQVTRCAGSRADDFAAVWAGFVKALPYRREPVEILRNPLETAKYGGDCDDLVCLLLCGWKCNNIPCEPEIIADDDDNGFHIRALIGFPVLDPTIFLVVDPVTQSEAAWATAIPQDLPTARPVPSLSLTQVLQSENDANCPELRWRWWQPVAIGLAIVGGVSVLKSLFRSRNAS